MRVCIFQAIMLKNDNINPIYIMGAWGHGHFQNDSALDFVSDVEYSDNPKKLFERTFNRAIKSNYLDSDIGCEVIVASTYLDSQINGTKFSHPDREEPLEVDTFPNRKPSIDFSDLRKNSVEALKKVINENSELNELWEENEENYLLWRQGIEELIERLTK
jgi:Domain of unknown function (DUF4259)